MHDDNLDVLEVGIRSGCSLKEVKLVDKILLFSELMNQKMRFILETMNTLNFRKIT